MAENTLAIRDQRTDKRFFVDNLFVDQYGPIIGPYGHAVYNVIVRHSTPKGRGSWPSHATIAKKAGCGTAKVKDVLKQFESLGLIAIRARFNQKTGRQTSNEYIILDPPPMEEAPPLEDTPPGYTADTPTPVPGIATNNPPSNQSSPINPPKNSPPKNDEPEKEKPDILDGIARFAFREPSESWTVPAAAGGADDWAPAVDAFAGVVGLDPSTVPKPTRREWSRQIQEVGRDWQAGPSLLTEVIDKVSESEFHWKTYSSPHGAKADLGVLIGQHRSGGIRRPKKKGSNGGTQASAIAGIAAFKDKLKQERPVEAEYTVIGEAL